MNFWAGVYYWMASLVGVALGLGGGRMWLWGNGLGFVVMVEVELGAVISGVGDAKWGQEKARFGRFWAGRFVQ